MPQKKTQRIHSSKGDYAVSKGKMLSLLQRKLASCTNEFPLVSVSQFEKPTHFQISATSEALCKLRVHYSVGKLTRRVEATDLSNCGKEDGKNPRSVTADLVY